MTNLVLHRSQKTATVSLALADVVSGGMVKLGNWYILSSVRTGRTYVVVLVVAATVCVLSFVDIIRVTREPRAECRSGPM